MRPQLFVVSYIFWPIKIVFSVVYFQFNVARKLSTASKEVEFLFSLIIIIFYFIIFLFYIFFHFFFHFLSFFHSGPEEIKSRPFQLFKGSRKSNIPIKKVASLKVNILGDPGADSGGKGKSKRAEKYIWNEEK